MPSTPPPSRPSSFARLPRAIRRPAPVLLASETVTVASLAAYDLFAQNGQGKLPKPGPILAALGFYGLLALFGSLGDTAARFAAAVGAVLALTVLVTGKRGKGLLQLIQHLTGQVAPHGSNG